MPDFTAEQMESFLNARAKTRPEKPVEMFLIGLFHKKLSELWIRQSCIPRDKRTGEMDKGRDQKTRWDSLSILKFASYLQIHMNKHRYAAGGVDTKEVDENTLESIYVQGLYFAGEILDVDGMCGGYNLQWAWSSGYVAGKNSCYF